MRIKQIRIQNYKSLVDFELDSPPPFCAFVGPNASGKSNIFEALEFTNYVCKYVFEAPNLFGGKKDIFSYNFVDLLTKPGVAFIPFYCLFNDGIVVNYDMVFSNRENNPTVEVQNIYDYATDKDYKEHGLSISDIRDVMLRDKFINRWTLQGKNYEGDYEQFFDNFSRIFIGASKLIRINQPSAKLLPDASNLSQIIGQIFQDENKKQDFIEWVQILIPEFQSIEVKQNSFDGKYDFFIYEESSTKPFPKHLISDGTYNILALMAAVYQSSEPQFLCIEEPENGLHPQAIKFLIEFFREKCEEEGHHIWLNTHSQTLVRCMEKDEIILVNKINGQTKAKRVTNMNHIDIKTDEAWLTNALGGGVSWSK